MTKRLLFATSFITCAVSAGVLCGQATPSATKHPQTRSAPAKPPSGKPATSAPTPAATAPEAPASGVHIVSTYTQGVQVFQNTTYIKDGRQRVEFPGMVTIEQCDLRRTVLLNPPAKRYRVETFGADPTNQPAAPVQPQRALQQPHAEDISRFRARTARRFHASGGGAGNDQLRQLERTRQRRVRRLRARRHRLGPADRNELHRLCGIRFRGTVPVSISQGWSIRGDCSPSGICRCETHPESHARLGIRAARNPVGRATRHERHRIC